MKRGINSDDLVVRCPNVKWKVDARDVMRNSEFLELVDDLVHMSLSGTARGLIVTLACYNYSSRIGWTLQPTHELVTCLKCIAGIS